MHRSLRTAALGLATTAATLAMPAAAFAAPAPSSPAPAAAAAGADISATLDKVFLTGKPWNPGATTHVTVHNGGDVAAKAFFVLTLPKGTELGATDICDQVTHGQHQGQGHQRRQVRDQRLPAGDRRPGERAGELVQLRLRPLHDRL